YFGPVQPKEFFIGSAITMFEDHDVVDWMVDGTGYLDMFHQHVSPLLDLIRTGRRAAQRQDVVFATQTLVVHYIDDAMSVAIVHARQQEHRRFRPGCQCGGKFSDVVFETSFHDEVSVL